MAWILRTGFQGINTYVAQSIYKPRIWLNRQNEKTEVSSGEKSDKMATLYIITNLCIRCLKQHLRKYTCHLPPHFLCPPLTSVNCISIPNSQCSVCLLPFNNLPYVYQLNLEEASYATFHNSSPSFPFHCYYPHLQSHCL